MTPEEIRCAALAAATALHAAPFNRAGSQDFEVIDTAKFFAHFITTGEVPAEDEDDSGEAHEPVATEEAVEEHPVAAAA